MTDTREFIGWAMGVALPESLELPKAIGAAKVQLVLVGLAYHADKDGFTFPSQRLLAEEISGLARRDIQNALDVLERARLIYRDGKRGRATRYRLAFDHDDAKRTGYPAQSATVEWTGERTGQWTGERTGYPGLNRTELNNSPYPQRRGGKARRRQGTDEQREDKPMLAVSPQLHDALARHGVPQRSMAEVLHVAQNDLTTITSPERRLMTSPRFALECLETVKATRDKARDAAPRCEVHTTEPAETCRQCAADIKVGQRPAEFKGRRYPHLDGGVALVLLPDHAEEAA